MTFAEGLKPSVQNIAHHLSRVTCSGTRAGAGVLLAGCLKVINWFHYINNLYGLFYDINNVL